MSPPRFTEGWVHNLHDIPDSTDAGRVIALALTFSIVACLLVLLRIVVRLKTIGTIGYDDYAITASVLIGVGYSATSIYQTRWGLGLSSDYLPEENIVRYSLIQYTGGPQYCLAILGFKVSLLASYVRVAGINRTYAVVLYISIGLVTISQLIFAVLHAVSCSPVAMQWDTSIEGKCINALAMYFALGATSLAWDVLIIVMPFPIIRRLKLDKRSKVALALLYGLGFFVTIVQGIRIQTIADLATYTDSQAIIEWSIVEINIGVIITCVPAFRPLLRGLGRKITSSNNTKLTSLRQRSKDTSATPRSKTNRQSNTVKSAGFVVSRDVTSKVPEDDEIELWDGWKGSANQHRRASAHAQAELRNDSGSSAAGSIGEGNQITVRRDVSVQYDEGTRR